MEPTLHPGGVYVLDRGYYRSHPLVRGDVVVLRVDGENLIKRIYALPGDQLTLLRYDDGSGSRILEPGEAPRLLQLQARGKLAGSRVGSLTIPPGYCYVLGDNSSVSLDSRDFGPVPIDNIVGRALL
jgi:signal peptidase I